MAAYLIVLEPARGGGASAFLLALVVTCGFGVWLFWRTYRLPLTDRRPTPRPLLASFVAFVLLLLVTSGVLLANVPNILPWLVTPELSVIAGLIFLGAATYFAYALLRRGWSNAGGQLAGFLAYDLVLILPLLARIPSVPDKWRLSLVVYIAILLSSGTLAAWYLFVNRVTRISNRRPPFEGR